MDRAPQTPATNKTYTLGTPGADAVRAAAQQRRREPAVVGPTATQLREARMRQARLALRTSPVEPMN
jgi:hypothetical protein